MTEAIVNHQGALAYDLLRASLISLAVQVPGQERRDHRATPPKDLAVYVCECVAAMDDELLRRGWLRPIEPK
jgi:hypothetical protein